MVFLTIAHCMEIDEIMYKSENTGWSRERCIGERGEGRGER